MSRCDDVRAAAPEVALDLLAGPERADVLAHLETCAACREEVGDLSALADALLEVAPLAGPPPGFEARVLDRIGAAPAAPSSPRWSWRPAAVAAAVALVAGVGGGLVVGGRERSGAGVRTAELVAAAGGGPTGRLVIFEDDRMVCSFDDTRAGAAYTVEVVEGGNVSTAGRFEAPGGAWSWSVELPVDGDDVDRVVVRGPDGEVRAEAVL